MPQAAQQRVIAHLVHAACIAHLGAIGETFGNAERMHIADHLGNVDEVVAHRRIREKLTLRRVNHVRCRRNESARLALQRQVLCSDRRSGNRRQSGAAHQGSPKAA